MKGLGRAILGLIALLFAMPVTAAAPPLKAIAGPWVELGADNQLNVRVVLESGVTSCPEVVADGATVGAKQRGAADGDFPITVCSASVPLATANLSIGGVAVATVPAKINRIVLIGDTGCRIAGKNLQDCNDPKQWPFATVAKHAVDHKPDLVIHVGDYLYRETACPADNKGCAGSPHGDVWATWQADFFDPAAPLLKAAPWVMVRGNHEICRRAGKGWWRMLDPHAELPECIDRAPAYRLQLGGLDLAVFDSGNADDSKAEPETIAAYAAQFASVLKNAPPHTWLLTHRPVWAMSQGYLEGQVINQTEQAAIRGQVPAGLDLVLSGHIHDFIAYDFGGKRPAQLIVGVAGDSMYDLAVHPPEGTQIDRMTVARGMALERFGVFVMERNGDGWTGTLFAADDTSVLAQCQIAGRSLDCHN
jgi:hypothetical protein